MEDRDLLADPRFELIYVACNQWLSEEEQCLAVKWSVRCSFQSVRCTAVLRGKTYDVSTSEQ